MKRILMLTMALVFSLSAVCFAAVQPDSPEAGSIAGIENIESIPVTSPAPVAEPGSIAGIKDSDIELTRGCCSHHRGVCGCDGGRAVCCDGQYSPTCGC